MKKGRIVLLVALLLTALFAVPTIRADEPIEGRDGRAEVRFLEGMIDHHQMALDMAQHCLAATESERLLTLCQDVIDAQSAEIEMMRGWLLDWYNIDYTPMSMLATGSESEHGGMGMGNMGDMGNMGEEGCQMMEEDAEEGAEGCSMMDNSEADSEAGAHSEHGQGGNADNAGEHAEHGQSSDDAEIFTDPAMTMGMMAGLDRLEGVEYEIAWLESMIDHHDDALHMAERILTRDVHPETLELAERIIADQTAEIALMETYITELSAE